jgi:hypothetical protein
MWTLIEFIVFTLIVGVVTWLAHWLVPLVPDGIRDALLFLGVGFALGYLKGSGESLLWIFFGIRRYKRAVDATAGSVDEPLGSDASTPPTRRPKGLIGRR